jgi:predicted nucleic acid-binding Zn ribbon protein
LNTGKSFRKPDELRAAGDILAVVMARLGLSGRLREREALTIWPEVVGSEIAKRSQPLRIKDGVLQVRITSAAWRQEVLFLKKKIISSFAEKLEPGIVSDIRFTDH